MIETKHLWMICNKIIMPWMQTKMACFCYIMPATMEIPFLIQAHPESSSVPGNDGKTPLQYLKETASCKDKRGMLLLHRQAAHSKGLSVKILPFLFKAYPEAVRVQDNLGLLPIHHACLNESSSLGIIMSLVKLYSESIVV